MPYLNGTPINIAGTGAERTPCSRRAESIAPHLGLGKPLGSIPQTGGVPRGVSTFTDPLSLPTAPQTGPLTASDPILRRLWALLLRPPRRGARTRMQLVLVHCGVSRNKACDAEAKREPDPTQLTDTWITGTVALAENITRARQLRAETRRSIAAGDWNPRARTPPSLVRKGPHRSFAQIRMAATTTATRHPGHMPLSRPGRPTTGTQRTSHGNAFSPRWTPHRHDPMPGRPPGVRQALQLPHYCRDAHGVARPQALWKANFPGAPEPPPSTLARTRARAGTPTAPPPRTAQPRPKPLLCSSRTASYDQRAALGLLFRHLQRHDRTGSQRKRPSDYDDPTAFAPFQHTSCGLVAQKKAGPAPHSRGHARSRTEQKPAPGTTVHHRCPSALASRARHSLHDGRMSGRRESAVCLAMAPRWEQYRSNFAVQHVAFGAAAMTERPATGSRENRPARTVRGGKSAPTTPPGSARDWTKTPRPRGATQPRNCTNARQPTHRAPPESGTVRAKGSGRRRSRQHAAAVARPSAADAFLLFLVSFQRSPMVCTPATVAVHVRHAEWRCGGEPRFPQMALRQAA
ncbi:hypothetical protein BCY84_12841 [Trypanosoma cruzi cruzi]|uniref:Uncharacterized protein n=1 Tax=Trypanosoma cruzi TaxID=5693 RepID=A0A2V2UP08_TRYCR|nr:hypothetical protein BCY84_12838 [Trypanosoma cruzi cruzi]PBJ74240.1 hypothetical protein BCY84_12841 [Trypanosoma cruzi cruzi]PWU85804.1 hypothetical protein C4B63_143g7 [Trypanosoma cruzi]